jgi:hypothetical protein
MNKILLVAAIILVVVVSAFGGGYWWYSSSVNFAYYGFSKGVKDKNVDEVKKYMDLSKFVDSFGDISASFGQEFGQEQKDSSKKDIEKAISDGKFVQNINLADSQWDAFNNKKLTADGSNYKLSLKIGDSGISQDVDFYFTKESSGWKVTKLKFDIAKIMSENSSSSMSQK